jgi:hypothetical protein
VPPSPARAIALSRSGAAATKAQRSAHRTRGRSPARALPPAPGEFESGVQPQTIFGEVVREMRKPRTADHPERP